MEFIYDSAKDESNRRKHGVSLVLALVFEWEAALIGRDIRRDYGEERMVAIGYIGLRLHVVVYVDRQEGRRIISLRRANKREELRYAKA